MRVLILHNRYRQPGGEDSVCRDEVRLLGSRGIDVVHHEVSNESHSALTSIRKAIFSSWSAESAESVREICRKHRPDVAHVHNFWMSLSPSVHAACHAEGVATVQTLHNYRLFCVNALFLRDGRICEDCVGKAPWLGVVRRCYRDSAVSSALVANMIEMNRRRGTWHRDVDAFIALSEFSKAKYMSGGLPQDRIWVKPNFVDDPGVGEISPSASDTFLFVGRLSPEKGVGTLLDAWSRLPNPGKAQLRVIGDGPERAALEQQALALGLRGVEFCGHLPPDAVRHAMARSRAVIMASVWYENFPRVIAESFAVGRSMIVCDVGAQREIVVANRLGWNFPAGEPDALASCLQQAVDDDALVDHYGENARKEYLQRYSADKNFEHLMEIYGAAIEKFRLNKV